MAELDAKQKKKRRAAIIVTAACVICVIGLFFLGSDGMSFDFDIFTTKEPVQHVYSADGQHRLSLYEPDWESDIFENRRWLDLNRYVAYVEGGMTVTLVDGDYASYGEPVAFLADYCDALMHGDAERLNSFYSDEYWKSHERYDKITMQKLYDIKIQVIENSDTRYVYKLTYKIMENDGTFRDDMVSDAERPQFYTMVETANGLAITDVSYSYQQ